MNAAQSQDVFRSLDAPKHARVFAAGPDHRFTPSLDHSRTDEVTFLAERAVLHAQTVTHKIAKLLFHQVYSSGGLRLFARLLDHFLDSVLEKVLGPEALALLIVRMVAVAQQRFDHITSMIEGMIKVHDLHRFFKAIMAHVLQPFGAVDQQHHLLGGGQPAAQGFLPEHRSKLTNGLDRKSTRLNSSHVA